FLAARLMHAKAYALPDAYLLRRDVFHPAHQAEAFVAIDQRNIERHALDGMHDRRGVDRSEPFTDAPFQPITASEVTKHARVKDGASRLGARQKEGLTAPVGASHTAPASPPSPVGRRRRHTPRSGRSPSAPRASWARRRAHTWLRSPAAAPGGRRRW